MPAIHFHAKTTVTPEEFVAGLTDFGPGRSKLFPNSADKYLEVHSQAPTEADVTEGSGGIWERLHYDWSDPTYVELTTTDSNVWGGDSGYTYVLTPRLDGSTDIDVDVRREGKNLKGRVLGFVLGTMGKPVLNRAFVNSVKAIEDRSAVVDAEFGQMEIDEAFAEITLDGDSAINSDHEEARARRRSGQP